VHGSIDVTKSFGVVGSENQTFGEAGIELMDDDKMEERDDDNQSFGDADINLMDDDSPDVTDNATVQALEPAGVAIVVPVVPMDSTVRGKKRKHTILYSDIMRECADLASIASKHKKHAEAVMGIIIAMKGLARNDATFLSASNKSYRELISTAVTMFRMQTTSAPTGTPLPGSIPSPGWPMSRRPKSQQERLRCPNGSKPVQGTSHGPRKCQFCLLVGLGHRIESCSLRIKWGARIENVKDLNEIAEDLMDPSSSRYPAERGQRLVASVLDSLPNETLYLVLHKKFIINPQLLTQCEKNLCVQVTCLGPSGISLNKYERCYVQAGQVRNWMTKYSNRAGKVLNALDKETFAATSADQSSSSDDEVDTLSSLSNPQKERK
jgi:hypothetical protein